MSEFLADASVRVTPDTSRFRAELEAQLVAATKGLAVKIPAIPVAAGTQNVARATSQAAAALEGQANAARNAGAAAQQLTTQATKATQVEGLLAKAATQHALALEEVAGATSTVALTQTQLTRARTADLTAEKAQIGAREIGAQSLIDEAAALRVNTSATLEQARASNIAAKANAEQGVSQAFAARGAGATALSLLGVRGATLAANSAFLAGAAAVVVFAKSVSVAASLERELNVFRVTAQATAEQMRQVGEASRALGADISLPAVSATDAVQAMSELAKAGLSVEDSIDAARGVLQLATAAEIDNAAATELVANALNSFGLRGADAAHVVDLLANASIQAQGSLGDMGDALTQVASVSRLVGISVEDTVALLTLLARNGIQGAAGGTVLRVALLRLVNPTKRVNDELAGLNVQLRDAQGNIRPEIFADLSKALEGLGKARGQEVLAEIFGVRGIRGAAILGREGVDALEAMRVANDRAGAGAELAGAQTQGFTGSLENLKNQLEEVGIALGQEFIPALQAVVDTGSDAAKSIGLVLGAVEDLRAGIKRGSPGGDGGEGFFDTLFGGSLSEQVADFHTRIESIKHDIALVAQEGPFKSFDQISTERAQEQLAQVQEAVTGIVASLREGDRDVSLNVALAALDRLIAKLQGGDAQAQKLATAVASVRRQITATPVPPLQFPEVKIPPELLSGAPGKDVGDALMTEFERSISGPQIFAITRGAFGQMGPAIQAAGVEAAASARDAAQGAIQAMTGQLAGLGEQFDKAVAADNRQAQLANLRRQAQTQEGIIRRAGPDAQGDLLRQRRKAQSDLASTNAQIRSIEAQIQAERDKAANDAEQRRNDAIRARNKADRAFLDTIGLEQQQQQTRILRAAGTESLADDIRRTTELQALYKRQIENARTRLKDGQTRTETVAGLTADLESANQRLADLEAQQRQRRFGAAEAGQQREIALAQQTEQLADDIRETIELRNLYRRQIAEVRVKVTDVQARNEEIARLQSDLDAANDDIKSLRQQQRARIEESLTLDIQIADVTQNRSKEEGAREAYIRWLQDQVAAADKGSLERKRLILKLRQEQADLRELKKEMAARNSAFSELSFQFLQSQQGFDANLLGNLIPAGAAAGTVGNISNASPSSVLAGVGAGVAAGGFDPSQQISDQSAVTSARGGATTGQMASLIHVQREMLRVLQDLRRGTGHPEAARSKVTNRAAQDYGGH